MNVDVPVCLFLPALAIDMFSHFRPRDNSGGIFLPWTRILEVCECVQCVSSEWTWPWV